MAQSGIEARRMAALEEGSASYLARRADIARTFIEIFLNGHGTPPAEQPAQS